jgi:hypothetical protein
MDKFYKIIDNALNKKIFLELQNIIEDNTFPWYCTKKINDNVEKEDLSCYFIHMLYIDDNKNFYVSPFFKLILPLLNIIQPKKLLRIKANLYPRTQTLEHHASHIDYNFFHNGAIFYVNSNDGTTVINNKEIEIESVANRLVLFNSALPHNSTSTTNQKTRINININYF